MLIVILLTTRLLRAYSRHFASNHNNVEKLTATFTNSPSRWGPFASAPRSCREHSSYESSTGIQTPDIKIDINRPTSEQPSNIDALALTTDEVEDSNSICHIAPTVSPSVRTLSAISTNSNFPPRNVAKHQEYYSQNVNATTASIAIERSSQVHRIHSIVQGFF